MKSGVRALGIAESSSGDRSTLAGAVVRADRVFDGLAFTSCTVGGMDATDAVVSLCATLDRADVQYVLVGAVAPAWYNLLELSKVYEATDRPVITVTFEESDGLEMALSKAFSGSELESRLEAYRGLPPRRSLTLESDGPAETVYVRAIGVPFETAADVVRAFTPEGGRPEPIRVARVAARAGAEYRE